jgi:hypothetical protein
VKKQHESLRNPALLCIMTEINQGAHEGKVATKSSVRNDRTAAKELELTAEERLEARVCDLAS